MDVLAIPFHEHLNHLQTIHACVQLALVPDHEVNSYARALA